MTQLISLLEELESLIPHHTANNPQVSKSSIGWHIEHALMTISQIIEKVGVSNPKDYKWYFKLPRLFVMNLGKIPRGRAQSPKNVIPQSSSDATNLMKFANETRAKIEKLPTLDQGQFFEHPFFGHLKLNDTIKFLVIHTKHHLDIANEINANG